jgi:hypothetical protein
MAEGRKKVLEEQLKKVAEDYGLSKDDLFIKEGRDGKWQYIIVNRAGVDKLERHIIDEGLGMVHWEPLVLDKEYVYLKFQVFRGGELVVHTTGEASMDNVDGKGKYLLAMAENRGRSRAVLKFLSLYENVKGEAESPDFEKESKGGKRERTTIKK